MSNYANAHPAEYMNFCEGFLPVALNSGANTADVISMKNYESVLIVFIKALGTASQDPTITLTQGTDIAFGTNKALNITTVYKKQAATNLQSTATYTKSTAASPATNDTFSTNTWTNSTLAEEAAIVLIHVRAEDLDADNGYDCIRASIADVGTNAQLGVLFYIGMNPRYAPPLTQLTD